MQDPISKKVALIAGKANGGSATAGGSALLPTEWPNSQ